MRRTPKADIRIAIMQAGEKISAGLSPLAAGSFMYMAIVTRR